MIDSKDKVTIYNIDMSVTLLTGNERKKESLERAAINTNISITTKKVWLPEIQAIECEAVAAFAAEYGANHLNLPVIKMDSGFFIEELNNFPGTLVHSVDTFIGAERFFLLLEHAKNKKAKITNAIAYCEPKNKPVIFSSSCEGSIVSELRNEKGSFVDRLFVPTLKNPTKKTMGELRIDNPQLAMELWGDAEVQLINWLKENRS